MAVVKDGPDVQLFTHAGALTKLALWMGEAIAEQEREKGRASGKKGIPLVLAGLNESRGVYVVVGTGGGGGVVDFAARRERQQRKEEKEKKKAERVAAKAAEKEKRRQEKAEKSDAADDAAESEAEEETEDEDDDDDDDDDDENEGTKGSLGRNRFGNAFQEVVDETNARVRIDSFEHCVVEVKKDDLSAFLETLSMKVVVG
jgi:cell division control protein 45